MDEQQNAEIELIAFSSKKHSKKTENLCFKVGSRYINYSISVRNLRIILDIILGNEGAGELYL